jgi:hypothetical protein
MKLTTEEKQYLEIFLWNDYNEKIIMKKEDLKPHNKFNIIYKGSVNNSPGRTPKRRVN